MGAPEDGSTRSSFDSRINVLEGLLAHERATGGTPQTVESRRRGQEYLLERSLFRRESTGEPVKLTYLQFSFPPHWHDDVLRALDHFREAGGAPDERLTEAVELVRDKQRPDATWLLDNTHPGAVRFPSRTATAGPAAGTLSVRCACCGGTSNHPAEPALPSRTAPARIQLARRARPYVPYSGRGENGSKMSWWV